MSDNLELFGNVCLIPNLFQILFLYRKQYIYFTCTGALRALLLAALK